MTPTPRDAPCAHPVSDGTPPRRRGSLERWACGLCGAHLTTDHATGTTREDQ